MFWPDLKGSAPAAVSFGLPHMKYAGQYLTRNFSGKPAAAKYSSWLMMYCNAWRAFGLLKGGCRWFGRSHPWLPSESAASLMLGFFSSVGMKSACGSSKMSASPLTSAASAVFWSGM